MKVYFWSKKRASILLAPCILTQKNGFYALGNMIRVILTFCPSRIPNPGTKKAPDPGSGSATLVNVHPNSLITNRHGEKSNVSDKEITLFCVILLFLR